MCGIAGYLEASGATADPSLLRRMCDRLAHRGPDAYGEYRQGGAGLGHRRLSIIDLSGGKQPMGNEDGSVQVAFNGEIYNFQELRADLVRKGHHFASHSDTEVLVHLYEEEGERMPERLNGMFAFAIWDVRRQQLFLARDRMGKKPLYYSFAAANLRVCFASEPKALLAAPGLDAKMSPQAAADFLCLSYVPDPESIFRKISKLAPAHSLMVTSTSYRLRRYWKVEFDPEPRMKFDNAVEEIQAIAGDAIEKRMISDVPLGAFLSGGVDSTAVTGMMAERARGRVKTFSIGFTDERFDESGYAAMAAERHETDHHTETVTPSILEVLDKLTEHFDEPFGDSSAVPMLYLSRMTRKNVTVALSGDGADELFGGYRRYFYGALEERLRERMPRWFRRSVIRAGARCYPKLDFMPQVFRAKTMLGNLAQEIGEAYFTSMTAFSEEGMRAALAPELRRELGGYSPRDSFRKRFGAVSHLRPLQQMQAVDLDTYLPGDILVKADRATMAYSLESRSPWLDYRLAELAGRLPCSFKIHGRTGKYVFKKAMGRYVPERLAYRRKMGFSVPLASWFRTSLKPVFETMAFSGQSEGLFDAAAVRRIWEQHQSGLHNHDRKLWNLLMLGLWRARFQPAAGSGVMEMAERS